MIFNRRMQLQVFWMTPSNEFRVIGIAYGESADAALHESTLDNPEAEAMSDLMTIERALKNGMDLDRAVDAYAGELARKRLIERGILNISPDELERELIAGITSGPATPMTSADWVELRRQVEVQLSQS